MQRFLNKKFYAFGNKYKRVHINTKNIETIDFYCGNCVVKANKDCVPWALRKTFIFGYCGVRDRWKVDKFK